MKNNTLHILMFAFLTLLISCSNSDSMGDDNDIIVIKTKEHKTNLPLEGVKVTLYGCSQLDFEFGCISPDLQAPFNSDANGNCRVPKNIYNKMDEKAVVEKSKYWRKSYKSSGTELAIEPEAWVTITTKTTMTYPSTSFIALRTTGELGVVSVEKIIPASTSNLNYRLFGNETNKIDWVLYESGNLVGIYCFDCPVISSGNFILHPQKFEQLAYTLNY